jgi:uncharacterized protein (DUF697 family)
MARPSGEAFKGKARKKKSLTAAWHELRDLLDVAEDENATDDRLKTANVAVYYDQTCPVTLRESAEQMLHPVERTVYLHVETFYETHCEVDASADLTLIFAGDSPWVGATALFSKSLGIPTIVITENLAAVYERAASTGLALSADDFMSMERALMSESSLRESWNALVDERFAREPLSGHDMLFAALGSWIVEHARLHAQALASAFPFIRRPYAHDRCLSVAYQNAALAAAVFLPGADMPLMMANQVRMVLDISHAYACDVSHDALVELLMVGAGSYALRGIARSLLRYIPALGVVSKTLVAFTGTLILGSMAMAYCERGGYALLSSDTEGD